MGAREDGRDGTLHRVTRFGVRLPLSHDLAQLGGMGTRHSAALGLAERTDALCIVVSEERGTVSVARHGVLERLREASELARSLTGPAAAMPARPLPRTWARLRRVRWLELAGSFAAVLVLWLLLVPGARPALLTVHAGVNVANLPPEWELESVEPASIDVTLSGPARALLHPRPERGRGERRRDARRARPAHLPDRERGQGALCRGGGLRALTQADAHAGRVQVLDGRACGMSDVRMLPPLDSSTASTRRGDTS